MRKSRFTTDQIIHILRQWDAGAKQIRNALATLGTKLNEAGNDMFDTDRGIAGRLAG